MSIVLMTLHAGTTTRATGTTGITGTTGTKGSTRSTSTPDPYWSNGTIAAADITGTTSTIVELLALL